MSSHLARDMQPALARGSTSGFSLPTGSRDPGQDVPWSWATCEGREDVVLPQQVEPERGLGDHLLQPPCLTAKRVREGT